MGKREYFRECWARPISAHRVVFKDEGGLASATNPDLFQLWVLFFCSPPAVLLADFQRARKVQTCSGSPYLPELQKRSAQELQVRPELRGAEPPSPVPA